MMNKNTARMLFMDYLYGEMDPEQKNTFEQFINHHPELKTELDALADVRTMLSHLLVENPAEQLVMMEPGHRGFKEWWKDVVSVLIPKKGFARTGMAFASILVLFVVIGAFTKMNIAYNETGFNLAFGKQQPVQTGFSAAEVEQILIQVRQENAQLVSQIVQTAHEEQEKQLQQTLASFADYIEDQRSSDLRLISTGLSNLEETTYNRLRQTDQVLGEFIQTVSVKHQ